MTLEWVQEVLAEGAAHFDSVEEAVKARREASDPGAWIVETDGSRCRIRHERSAPDPAWEPVDG